MPEGCVAIADAMGVTNSGIFGDILCMRMVKRGVQALITDGVMRDKVGVLKTGLPLWCSVIAAPPSVNAGNSTGSTPAGSTMAMPATDAWPMPLMSAPTGGRQIIRSIW